MTMPLSSLPFSAQQKPTRGFTLTEIAIVLGIIGFILGAIWAAAGMVYENNRSKQAATQMLSVVNNWKAVFGSKRLDIADGNDMTQMTINNGFASTDMVPPSGTIGGCVVGGAASNCFINGPWSGSQVNVISYQNDNGVAVQYTHLSQTACNHLANAITNTSALISLAIDGNTAAKFPPIGTDAFYTSSDISRLCANTKLTNSVLAEFSLN